MPDHRREPGRAVADRVPWSGRTKKRHLFLRPKKVPAQKNRAPGSPARCGTQGKNPGTFVCSSTLEKCKSTISTLTGVSPLPLGLPPPAITPGCSVIIAQHRGDRLKSPPLSYQHREFPITGKGILQKPFSKKNRSGGMRTRGEHMSPLVVLFLYSYGTNRIPG